MLSTEIDQLLEAAVSAGDVAGVVALAADDGGTLYQGAFGRRGIAANGPMTLDTVFRIASMTKAVTAVAAMQLVERGRLSLDQPVGDVLPQLAAPLVLEGFDDAGQPRLRPAKRPITLRHLLTHTAGFVYDFWNAELARFVEVTGLPSSRSSKLAALDAPLAFDPGERWEYGTNLDWTGRLVEAASGQTLDAYMQAHIFAPLGITDTGYLPGPDRISRLGDLHARLPNGSLRPVAMEAPAELEYFPGGTGLFSTGPDYLTFLRMLLHGGSLCGATILQRQTVTLMAENHIGSLLVQPFRSQLPRVSNDVEFFPGMEKKWGLSFLINTTEAPTGRSPGSLAWGGLYNCYYWIDPTKRVTGLLMTQILPFADEAVLRLTGAFETAIYRSRATPLR
jgi:CubicO group peptidase (beta-lactamase class C family)